MIRFFCVLLCSLCFLGYNQAQASKKELDKLGDQVASQMCYCFNKSHSGSSDKELVKILDKMQKKGDAEAEKYIASLSAEKQNLLFAAMVEIENLNHLAFDDCLEGEVNNNATVYISSGGSESGMLSMIMTKLKKKKQCKLFYAFLVLSQRPK